MGTSTVHGLISGHHVDFIEVTLLYASCFLCCLFNVKDCEKLAKGWAKNRSHTLKKNFPCDIELIIHQANLP